MAELGIDSIILFEEGFTITTIDPLQIGTTYHLNILDSNGSEIQKMYIPTSNSQIIIDSWNVPIGTTCFTLTDTQECPPLSCKLILS